MSSTIYLPDTLHNWPWPRIINPNYEECKAESKAWTESFHVFSPKAQKAFNECDFNLVASMAYATLNKDGCRVGCDLMNVFFAFDEWSDVADPLEAKKFADIIMDAIYNPHKPRLQGEWMIGEMTRQFWANAVRTATPSAQRRFVEEFQLYTDSVVQQAIDRKENHIHTIDSYFAARRLTVGAMPSFAINEIHLNIPDYVMEDETIKRLQVATVDMIAIDNDLISYNVEQARGDDSHNLVTIVMHQMKLNVQEAFDWIAILFDKTANDFLENYNNVPSWGLEVDEDVKKYIDALGNWTRANNQWSFESGRYFGTDGLRIQETRIVELLPKKKFNAVKPDQQADSMTLLNECFSEYWIDASGS